jgi:hydroxymethylpyrimidine pyrophosphatase-like HAD family hydrolase
MKGIIALDIDGTVTDDHDLIPEETTEFLDGLIGDGWDLIFVTGRSYPRTLPMLRLENSFFLAVHNGAHCFELPSGKEIFNNFLGKDVLPLLEEACEDEPCGIVVYGPQRERDVCYYDRSRFKGPLMDYLESRAERFGETWRSLDDFEREGIESFPAVKFFGSLESLERICGRIHYVGALVDIPIIGDPFGKNHYVAQATAHGVNKGDAVKRFAEYKGNGGPVIAAGDDRNDLPMLQMADCAVAMGNAPEDVIRVADIVASPASENGIIQGLKQAVGGKAWKK